MATRGCLFASTATAAIMLMFTATLYQQDDIASHAILSVFVANVSLGSKAASMMKSLFRPKLTRPEKPIVILAWSAIHSENSWNSLRPPIFSGCAPELNCVLTENRSHFNESAAVIFHMTTGYWWMPTPWRRPDQYYVFALWEAPTHESSGFTVPKGFFNLTMTYRRDADIFWPYGSLRRRVTPRNQSEPADIDQVVRAKTKLVAWMASKCPVSSRRERYVSELRKHIPVDAYGACGNLTCPRDPRQSHTALGTKHWKPCESMLGQIYKFYLAFENSVCKDYATEKFFQRMDNAYVVPVVLERHVVLNAAYDEETRKVLNSTFIAADDFDTPKELADYLTYLDQNHEAYMRYFEWRRDFEVQFEDQFRPGCDLCRVVTEGKVYGVRHVVEDIKDWWSTQAHCHEFKVRNKTA